MPKLSHFRITHQRTSLRALITAGLMAAVSLTLVPVASAGEYRVYSCRKPVTWETITGADWVGEARADAAPPSDVCLNYGHMDASFGAPQRGTQAWTGLGLRVPDGLLVTRLQADRFVGLTAAGDNGASIQYDLFAGSKSKPWDWSGSDVVESCRLASGCTGKEAKLDVSFANGVSFLGFAISCRGEAWGACGVGSVTRGFVRINYIDMTVRDVTAPQTSAASGSLLQPGARKGTQSLIFGATDVGAGVYEAIVRVDGKEVARNHPDSGASCADAGVLADSDLEFTRIQPCSVSVGASFSIDTTLLTEGTRKLEVVVRDAAGNTNTAVAQDVLIDNVPAPTVVIKPTVTGATIGSGLRPGDSVTAQSGIWGGPTPTFTHRWQRTTSAGTWIDIPSATGGTYRIGQDDVERQLRVLVTATTAEGATEAASEATGVIKSGATVVPQSVRPTPSPNPPAPGVGNGGGGNPATGQLVVDREQRTVDVRHGAKIVITGRLVDADGNPIADATLDVFEQIAIVAAPWTKVDTVKTDSQGGYVYRPKTTASRRLRFAYSDKREASDYRATREVFVSVTAAMSIKARSRVVPRKGLIRISGQVVIDQLPANGAWVEVQVLDARVWRTVATRRVDANGGWTFKHRLRQASATRFTFRSRLRAAGNLPTTEAKSTPVKVRVR